MRERCGGRWPLGVRQSVPTCHREQHSQQGRGRGRGRRKAQPALCSSRRQVEQLAGTPALVELEELLEPTQRQSLCTWDVSRELSTVACPIFSITYL